MNDPSAFRYQEDPTQAPIGPGPPINPGQYKFSQDELRVLNECNNESFFQRSVPLGTLLGLGTYAAVQTGRLKPNPRFGAFPKVTVAVIAGYFLGKLSYQRACADKLMALPDSYIGQLLRDKRDGKISRSTMPAKQPSSMLGASPGDIYSDAGPGSALNLDTDRPIFSDDAYKLDSSDAPVTDTATAPAAPVLSYDELRRRNRGQYSDSRQDPYRFDPAPTPPVTHAPPAPAPPRPAPTNKYGDVME